MFRKIYYLIPLLFLFLIPNQVFAAESSVSCTSMYSECNGIVRGIHYKLSDGTVGSAVGSVFTPGNYLLPRAGEGNSYYVYSLTSPPSYLNYTLEEGKKYSIRIAFNTYDKLNSSPIANIDNYLSDLYLTVENMYGEVLPGNFYSYLNFGLKLEEQSSTNLYTFVIDIIPNTDIKKFYFDYRVKSSEKSSSSILVEENVNGELVSNYYEPFVINTSGSYGINYSSFNVYEVDEFTFLDTTVHSPVIPNPDNKPVFDTYNPDVSVIDGLFTCEQDNILDRFTCVFKNFQELYNYLLTNLGNGLKTLINNTSNFFNHALDFEVLNWSLADFSVSTDETPISDLLTMPMTLINSFLTGIQGTCATYTFPEFYGYSLSLPCLNLEKYIGSSLWNIIDSLCCLFLSLNIGLMTIHLFDKITSFEDIFDILYEPRHAYTGYHPKHGKE